MHDDITRHFFASHKCRAKVRLNVVPAAVSTGGGSSPIYGMQIVSLTSLLSIASGVFCSSFVILSVILGKLLRLYVRMTVEHAYQLMQPGHHPGLAPATAAEPWSELS